MIGKATFMTFSLTGAATHVIRIGNQWENRARGEEISFRTTMTLESQECPHLRKFPYLVQRLIADQWKLAAKSLADGDEPAGEMPDQLICSIDCLFGGSINFHADICDTTISFSKRFKNQIE